MMKKILTAALVAIVSTGAMAQPNVKTLKVNSHEISSWVLDAPTDPSSLPESWGILTTAEKQTVIFFVNDFRTSNPRIHSDPILLDCRGVPTIINPGKSAVCVIGGPLGMESTTAIWSLASGYVKNGSDGYTITLG